MQKTSSTTKLVIFLVVLGLISYLASLYVDWLWFKSVPECLFDHTIKQDRLVCLCFPGYSFAFCFQPAFDQKAYGAGERTCL